MIKWTGRSIKGTKWWTEAKDFLDLYNQLCFTKCNGANEPISMVDYDPYDRAKCEKAGEDYFDIICDEDKEWEEIQKEIEELEDLTDEEIVMLIRHENGDAFYQNFFRWDYDKQEWINWNDDEEKWFDENGKYRF